MKQLLFLALSSALLVTTACTSDPVSGASSSGYVTPSDAGPAADGDAPASDAGGVAACGRGTTLCDVGSRCEGAPDCSSGSCRDGTCHAITPSDGTKNGDETDVDCGGTKAPACADGKSCKGADDCTSGVCAGSVCQIPSPTDTVRNGDETDVDCGGTKAPKCADSKGCQGAGDCTSGVCSGNVCRIPSATDTIQNGDETDVDCGGTKAPKCADLKSCAAPRDCTSGVCTANVCQIPSVDDHVKNGDETDVDCGGTKAPKCADLEGCALPADCISGVCGADKRCSAPTDSDGVKNGTETGTDCGGPSTPKKCPTGSGCNTTNDCDRVRCSTAAPKTCEAPAPDDGIKNDKETDIDCGGNGPARRCNVGETCGLDGDCASSVCGYQSRCVPAPSCRVHEGGDTCGARETGAAGQSHESCCASVALPGSAIRVDKYEITAGRMREFIRAVDNNVAGWVSSHRAITQQIPDNMVQYLPTGLSTPSRQIRKCEYNGTGCSTRSQSFGVYDHLGNTVFMEDRPCANCGQGCWIGGGQYENGHPTYWWPQTTQANEWGAIARVADRSYLDEKSLNCVTQPLLAAFCAWDGGRLPTQAELGGTSGAWGPATYPWGASPSYTDTAPGANGRQAYTFKTGEFLVPMRTAGGGYNLNAYDDNTTNYNPFPDSPSIYQARYVYPMPAAPNTNDQAYAIAAPGRMRRDFRAIGPGADDGYFDVLGNLLEIVADPTRCTDLNKTTSQCASSSGGTGFCGPDGACYDDADHNGWARVYWVGASFEGHGPSRTGHNLNVMTKYGKAGGRCVRP